MPIAYQYCTGRVDVYVGPSVGSPYDGVVTPPNLAVYLGTCEQYPMVQGGQNWNPWFADATGNMEPADWEFEGEYRVIAMDLNKMVQGAVDVISNFGYASSMDIGQLLVGGKQYFALWLRFSNYFDMGAARPTGLPPGEFYPCCRLLTNAYGPLGTRTRTTQLVVRTSPLLKVNTTLTLVGSTTVTVTTPGQSILSAGGFRYGGARAGGTSTGTIPTFSVDRDLATLTYSSFPQYFVGLPAPDSPF